MRRTTWLGSLLLAALSGCGKDNFQAAPDCSGRFLVAYARQLSVDQADVYLFDLDGQGFYILPNLNSTTEQDLNPTLTRDLQFIAFERVLSPTNTDIMVYDRCQAILQPQPGLDTQASERDPAFTGDGLKLAFVRDTLGRREVRLYNGAVDQLVPLPGLAGTGPYFDADPSANQDGSRIAFTSNRSGNNDVLIYDATGDSLMSVPDLASPGNDVDPSLTPDGKFVAFASDRVIPGDYDLYLYNLQTRSFVTLSPEVNTTYMERRPSLNVDTLELIFESNRPGTQGSTDLYLLTQSTGHVIRVGASSPAADVQPWIVWQ
jgi:WD40 repeat protein